MLTARIFLRIPKLLTPPHFRPISTTLIECNDPELKPVFDTDLQIIENFISVDEEASLLAEIEPYIKRLRYEYDHWDDAIHGYRETERLNWNQMNQLILNRVKQMAFGSVETLSHVHILDLHENGYIKPHVDAVRFCGNRIAGLSLLTDCVMRFRLEAQKDRTAQALLKRRSLYLMKDRVRYDFAHEILKNGDAYFQGREVTKTRRLSVICRNKPPPEADK